MSSYESVDATDPRADGTDRTEYVTNGRKLFEVLRTPNSGLAGGDIIVLRDCVSEQTYPTDASDLQTFQPVIPGESEF